MLYPTTSVWRPMNYVRGYSWICRSKVQVFFTYKSNIEMLYVNIFIENKLNIYIKKNVNSLRYNVNDI